MTFKRENPRHVCVTQVITAWSRVTCPALSEADQRQVEREEERQTTTAKLKGETFCSNQICQHNNLKTATLQMTLVCELLVLVSIYKPGPSTNIISDRGVNV